MSEAQEKLFGQLLDESWKLYNEMEFDREIPGVFICGLTAAMVADGWSLIDFNGAGGEASSLAASTSAAGSPHALGMSLPPQLAQLRFQRLASGERLLIKVSHVHDALTGRLLGRRVGVHIGYGERVQDAGRIWQVLKQEFKSGFITESEPGVIRFDAEVTTGYIYATVGMMWSLDRYVDPDRSVDYPRVQEHVGAVLHSLGKYLRGRIA